MIKPIEPLVKDAAYWAACAAVAHVLEGVRQRLQAEAAAGIPPGPTSNPPYVQLRAQRQTRARRPRRPAGVTPAGRC